ncbi:hypothetical protein ADIS_0071 [Lunatimonas lonarensis]|uniref:histidine kinase n=1 Tax=Lunatimonas lonarensis TaxID=1232681 RepID=R7ZZ61_9BACT|nr:response regulator [Lunatimonas lonarensis]EON79381.1 hypothetical protein ADIS_0071 [Lunatimonas lonarensis]
MNSKQPTSESIALLQNLLDNTSDATQVCLENGNLFYINKEASKRLGIKPDEVKNYHVWDFEELFRDRSVWFAHVDELKKMPHMIIEGTNFNQVTGKKFPVEVTVKFIEINGQGYVVANSRDISERKKVEEQLQYTNVFLRRAMNMANMGSWELELASNILKWTENLYKIHELSPDTPIDLEKALGFYNKKDQATIQRKAEEVILTGKEGEFIGKIHLKGKRFKWVKLKILYLKEQGKGEKIIGLTQDITEERLAKMEVDRQLELQQLMIDISSTYINTNVQDLSRTVNESLSRISLFVNADRGYVFAYDFGENTTSNTYEWCADGITPELDNLQNLPLDLIPDWVEQHKRSMTFEVGDIDTLENQDLKDIIEPQGIKTLIALPMVQGNTLMGFVGFDWVKEKHAFQDAEKKLLKIFADLLVSVETKSNLERSLVRAKEEAEKSSRAKSEFLANMSHEIRTPLNGVIGFTDLLINTNLSDVQLQYVQSANSSAHSLLGIINDILDFSKIEAGKLELEEIETDIIELIEQTADIVKFNTSSKDLEFLLNIQVNIPNLIVVDAIRLKQIMVNLLSNAIKFTEKGEVELKVSFEAVEENPNVGRFTFSVKDTGIGISAEQQEKLFKSFSQADSSTTRKFGGTGLGLVISQMIAEKMGSGIQLESEVGNGSTFFFTIERPFLTKKDAVVREFSSIKRILIIDDNANNRRILRDTLHHWKIDTEEADNGLSALRLLQEEKHFDILIVDFHMPFMDGLMTIAEANKIIGKFKGKKPKIILYSSVDDVQSDERYQQVEVDAKLIKPAKISELFNCLLSLAEEKVGFSDLTSKESKSFDLKSGDSLKIMIAEDVSLNMILLKTILRANFSNCQIIEAKNGQEAIDFYMHHSPDLIFMDVQMPIKDGYQATQEIRTLEQESGTHTPIVALTAGALLSEKEACLSAGMNYFMTKPLDKQKILDLVREIFDTDTEKDPPLAPDEFDYDGLLETLSGDRDLLISIMNEGFSEIEESLKRLRSAIMIDEKEKESLLHKIKGLSGSLGMQRFAATIEDMENITDPVQLIGRCKKAQIAFEQIKSKIERKLG